MGWFRRKKSTSGPESAAQSAAPQASAPGVPAGSSTVEGVDEAPVDAAALAAARELYRETAREWIRPGFRGPEDLAEDLVEYRDDIELPEAVAQKEAALAVARAWDERMAEQETWTEPGDYARVQAAFDGLAGEGIVARMNFTCCQTCGTDEIDDERTELGPDEVPVREGYGFREWGYTFFHQQDADRLGDEPAELYLSFSCFLPAPSVDPALVERMLDGDDKARQEVINESDLAAGRRVVAALRTQGLDVEWPEDRSQRIKVVDLRWRKPLPV